MCFILKKKINLKSRILRLDILSVKNPVKTRPKRSRIAYLSINYSYQRKWTSTLLKQLQHLGFWEFSYFLWITKHRFNCAKHYSKLYKFNLFLCVHKLGIRKVTTALIQREGIGNFSMCSLSTSLLFGVFFCLKYM